MQKYNDKEINEQVSSLEEITLKIKDILAFDGTMNLQQIETVSGLYKKRKDIVDNIQKWFDSDDSKKYRELNPNKIEQRIKTIVNIDKDQMKNMKDRINKYKEDLRKLANKKSVLIYSSEK